MFTVKFPVNLFRQYSVNNFRQYSVNIKANSVVLVRGRPKPGIMIPMHMSGAVGR